MAEARYPGLDAAGWGLQSWPQKQVDLKMPDDLKTAKTALVKLHQDMEAINRLAKPSYLSLIEQMERSLEPIRRQHLELSRAFEMSGAMARIQEIASANQHWQELIKQASATSRIAESLSAAHQSWLDTIKPIQHDFSHLSQLQASAKLACVIHPCGLPPRNGSWRASISRR